MGCQPCYQKEIGVWKLLIELFPGNFGFFSDVKSPNFSLAIHFTHDSVYKLMLPSPFVLSSPSATMSTSPLSTSLSPSSSVQFSRSVCPTLWTAACHASLSITNSWSSLKLMSIESVMPSNHLILCRPLLLLPSIFPSIRVFSDTHSRLKVAERILPLRVCSVQFSSLSRVRLFATP